MLVAPPVATEGRNLTRGMMMGDMAEAFSALKEYRKEQRKERLANANTEDWHKHSEYHYSRKVEGVKLQWWPSTVKAMYKNKMFYGYREVNNLFKKLGLGAPQ